jgi:bZIP transcription factor
VTSVGDDDSEQLSEAQQYSNDGVFSRFSLDPRAPYLKAYTSKTRPVGKQVPRDISSSIYLLSRTEALLSFAEFAICGLSLKMGPNTDAFVLKAPPSISSVPSTTNTTQQAILASLKPALEMSQATAGNNSDESSSDTNNKQKRPLLTHTKDGQQLSEKKLRRLEKNRLSARECRRRKREATENIQHQINAVEAENLQLRLQLQIGQEAESCIASEQSKVTQDIDNLLQSGASEADIYATLEEFKEKYADYGKSRRSSIEFHLRQIERLLMPTTTTSVAMLAIQGGIPGGSIPNQEQVVAHIADSSSPELAGASAADLLSQAVSPSSTSVASVHSTDSIVPPPQAIMGQAAVASAELTPSQRLDPKALFQYLVQYLEVSPQQAAAMKDSRLVAQEMDGCLETALGVLSELRQRLAQTGEDLETEFYNVRSILTPTQAAKFLVWVANNDACMHMLNELWDRVYPQPDSSSSLPPETGGDDASPDSTT